MRLRNVGFEGVELGAHTSYFLASFLSGRTNLRTDRYGGSIENRVRTIIEIVDAIRADAGADFPIGIRMSASEGVAVGQGVDEYLRIAKALEEAGLDYIALTTGAYETMDASLQGNAALIGSGEARIFKANLGIPVMLQGIHDSNVAASAIAGGDGDMVMLGRPLLVDPDYPKSYAPGIQK